MKVFIVEDEDVLRKAVCLYLSKKGFVCESAGGYREALLKLNIYEYDCIVLDINLPDGNGLELLAELKKRNPMAAVIIVSSKIETEDKVKGLEIGADDYLAKPFEMIELEARIKSLFRRVSFKGQNEIIFKEIKILPEAKKVLVHEQEISLSMREYNLFLYLIKNRDKIVSKEAMAEHIWGDDADQSDSFDQIYTHLKNLRKKLTKAGATDYLKTVYGMGYSFTTNHS